MTNLELLLLQHLLAEMERSMGLDDEDAHTLAQMRYIVEEQQQGRPDVPSPALQFGPSFVPEGEPYEGDLES